MNKPCYDACRKSSPEVVNAAIETKWAALMSNMFDSTGFDVLGFAEAARLFKDSQPDIQELKELIKTSVTKQGQFYYLASSMYLIIFVLNQFDY